MYERDRLGNLFISDWSALGSPASSYVITLLREGSLLLLFPLDDLQIQHCNAIQHWNEKQSDKCSDTGSANLRVTKRLPEKTAMNGERKERKK